MQITFWIGCCLLLSAAGRVEGQGAIGSDPNREAWTRLRGPEGSGLDLSQPLPTDLSPKNAIWSAELPGAGHSSPIVWGDQVWITCYMDSTQELQLRCFDSTSGQMKWTRQLPTPRHPMHRLNLAASSTPAVDDRGVYLLNYQPGHLELHAWDHQGRELWTRDFGNWSAQHGFGTSPIVCEGNIVFLNSQEAFQGLPDPGDSRLIAVAAETGNDVWTCDLLDDKACYAVPTIWRDAQQKTWLVCATQGDGILLVDARTGDKAWNCPVFKQRTVGSPIVVGNCVWANNGSGGGGNYIVRLPLDQTPPKPTLEIHSGASYVPSLIAVDRWLFVFGDNGVVTCVLLTTGEEQWQFRIGDGFWASPVSDGRHLYCLDRKGVAHVLAVDSSPRLVGSYSLGHESQATAAIRQGKIYLRTTDRLWCFGASPSPGN